MSSGFLYRIFNAEEETFECCGCCTSGFWDGIKAMLGYEAMREIQDATRWLTEYRRDNDVEVTKQLCWQYVVDRPNSVLYDLYITNHL